MDIKDIKIGMKVKLLSKHGLCDDYDNIEDWFDVLEGGCDALQIKKQGYGIVSEIGGCGEVWVTDGISNDEWCFLPSDLEPYESIDKLDKTKSKYIFSPTMEIKDLVYDIENGTTIVYFTDGTKKIARTEDGTEFDKETGLLECLGKKLFGNRDGLLKVIESGKVIERKNKGKVVDEVAVFDRFLKGGKIAINCETEEEAKELFTILNRQGVKWVEESEELPIGNTEWICYKKDTCYDNSEGGLEFGSISCYERDNFKIIKFKDCFQ